MTGNPVRPAVLEAAKTLYRRVERGEPFRLLVFGGSQGAQFFSDAVPAAIALLSEAQRKRLNVTQQARAEDAERVKAAYAELGVAAEVLALLHRHGGAHGRRASGDVALRRIDRLEIAVIGRPGAVRALSACARP